MNLHCTTLDKVDLNTSYNEQKYQKNYLKGQLKTNICFNPSAVFNIFMQDEPVSTKISKKIKYQDNYNPILMTNGEKEEQAILYSNS